MLILLQDTESLLVHLLLTQYLKEAFTKTAYSINVYVQAGANALRLSRFAREEIEAGRGPRIKTAFLNKKTKRKSSDKEEGAHSSGPRGGKGKAKASPEKNGNTKKRKRDEVSESEDDKDSFIVSDDDEDEDAPGVERMEDEDEVRTRSRIRAARKSKDADLDDEGDDGFDDWDFTFSGASRRKSASNPVNTSTTHDRRRNARPSFVNEDDVIVLSE